MRAAAERGRLIHGLFERLPGVAGAEREDAANRWLRQVGGIEDPAERQHLTQLVCGILSDDRFAALFGPGSLGEAPISAVVEGGLVIAGTVDRLLITPDRVQVVDFKTGRVAPERIEDVPIYHIRQMAAYAAALAVIFPGRSIEAGLLYTAGPRIITLPPELLARHKPGYSGAEQSLITGR
jgi:ATP-dependent helicase/nuclease subunit A